jgi:hypothetical protein
MISSIREFVMCPWNETWFFDQDPKNVIKLKLKDFELKKNQAQTPLEKSPNNFYNVKTKIKHTY